MSRFQVLEKQLSVCIPQVKNKKIQTTTTQLATSAETKSANSDLQKELTS